MLSHPWLTMNKDYEYRMDMEEYEEMMAKIKSGDIAPSPNVKED